MKSGSRTKHSLAKHIESQYVTLARFHGPLSPPAREKPLEVLIRTILSQNTTDVNSDMAYRLLRQRFPEWNEVMNAAMINVQNA